MFGMLAFFAVIFAVNGAFVYFALNSWPGLSVDKAYERGRQYNQTLDAASRQEHLRWRSQIKLTPSSKRRQHIEVEIRAAENLAVDGLSVRVGFRRPVREGWDQLIDLKGAGAGAYSGNVALPAIGLWNAEVRVGDETPLRYRMVHRVMVSR
ncbi:MAG: FixH family protein [Rhodospirillaceae bacterium]|nr:FixH family protein [Rhodospirillaceae bacterium]